MTSDQIDRVIETYLSVADRGLREGLLYAQMSADGVLEDGPF